MMQKGGENFAAALPFAAGVFTSAYLLFQVQPMIARYILPWFGGSPGVWTTCMMFFQLFLLAGYLYAHLLARWLAPSRQIPVHLCVLAASLAIRSRRIIARAASSPPATTKLKRPNRQSG